MIGDYTALEQNAIGNWFMTIGQILEANAAIQQAIEGNNKRKTSYVDNLDIIKHLSKDNEDLNYIKNILTNLIKKIEELEKK